MKGRLEDLTDKTCIGFPHPIRLSEAKRLLLYVASSLGPETEIRYSVETQELIVPQRDDSGESKGRHVYDDEGARRVQGDITNYPKGTALIGHFSLERRSIHSDQRTFESLVFHTTPGEVYEMMNPAERSLIESTRRHIGSWFETGSGSNGNHIPKVSGR